MPRISIPDTAKYPTWADPKLASVFDAPGQGILRKFVGLLGLDDPNQIMGVGAAMEVGPMTGGALEALAGRFPRFANAIKSVYRAPAPGGVPAAPFYSRLDDAAAALPKQTFGPKVLGVVQKGAASTEELAARGVPEFVAGYGNKPIQRAALEAHLEAHPVPALEVKVLGGPASTRPMPEGYRIEKLAPSGARFQGSTHTLIGPDGSGRAFYASDAADAQAMANDMLGLNTKAPTKFDKYQLPGGADYRETLITLPIDPNAAAAARSARIKTLIARRDELAASRAQLDPLTNLAEIARHDTDLRNTGTQIDMAMRQTSAATDPTAFRSGHFDEPNILAHTRSNTREIPGLGKGTFLEEVQSDWHQKGKSNGYALTGAERVELEAQSQAARAAHLDASRATNDALERVKFGKGSPEYGELSNQLFDAKVEWRDAQAAVADRVRGGGMDAAAKADYLAKAGRVDAISEQLEALQLQHGQQYDAAKAASAKTFAAAKKLDDRLRSGVPDAPFKESWPDLALKHHLAEAAQDPTVNWIGFTSGKTQAARYDLSKQIDSLQWVDWPGGGPDHGVLTAYKDGRLVMKETVARSDVGDYVGKEAGGKLLASQIDKQSGARYLEGVDLKVGGEGMEEFYDKLLPKRLEKIVKPYGGTVERISTRSAAEIADDIRALEAGAGDFGPAFQAKFDALERERILAHTADPKLRGSWILRLTPELKDRILKYGLPLMAGVAAVDAGKDGAR